MTVGSVSSGRVVSSLNLQAADALSPVQQLLAAQKAAATAATASSTTATTSASDPTDYQDQDWYIKAKVVQLKGEIATYSDVPGLDPSGSIMDSLTKEVNDLVTKEQNKEKAEKAQTDAAQAKLEAQQKQAALDAAFPSVDLLLSRAADKAAGKAVSVYTPPSATSTTDTDTKIVSSDDMLAHVRGSVVNTTA